MQFRRIMAPPRAAALRWRSQALAPQMPSSLRRPRIDLVEENHCLMPNIRMDQNLGKAARIH
jgi:hypothetical protein